MTHGSKAHSMIALNSPARSRFALFRLVLIAGSIGLCAGFTHAAMAGTQKVSLECSSFCGPLDAHQLERARAEGVVPGAPAAALQLSVVLWDENRRIMPSSGTGTLPASPTGAPLTVTPPNSLPAPTPVLAH